ncbi:MAG: hypothetical protein ACI8SJ_000790 [Shewanella sp.]|jgi:hypothetical protein
MTQLRVAVCSLLLPILFSGANFCALADDVELIEQNYVAYQINIESKHEDDTFVLMLMSKDGAIFSADLSLNKIVKQ